MNNKHLLVTAFMIIGISIGLVSIAGCAQSSEKITGSDSLTASQDPTEGYEDISWPESEIAKMIPVPDSLWGKVLWESEDGFAIYIGNISQDDYNAYVLDIQDLGFTEDSHQSETSYYGDNEEGYRISLDFEEGNIMFIRMDTLK